MPTPQQKKRRRKQRERRRERRANAPDEEGSSRWAWAESERLLWILGGISGALALGALLLRFPVSTALLLHLGFFSLASGALFALDKRLRGLRTGRVSRDNLMLSALAGGAAGALLVMLVTDHRMKSPKFRRRVPAALVLHVIAVAFAM